MEITKEELETIVELLLEEKARVSNLWKHRVPVKVYQYFERLSVIHSALKLHGTSKLTNKSTDTVIEMLKNESHRVRQAWFPSFPTEIVEYTIYLGNIADKIEKIRRKKNEE